MPERQQTLRRTIQWSYDLLTPAEQRLFRRLSVFAGGCTLEAVEAVCNTTEDLGVPVLEGVTSLVENSLLVQRLTDDAEPRFSMLETFREYGRDRLIESGEADATERAHAAYMLVLAEEETLGMTPAQRDAWLQICDAEHDNLRAASHYLVSAGDASWALRLAGALFRFWEQREHLTEGCDTLERVLAMPGSQAPTHELARALFASAVLSDLLGENVRAEQMAQAACAIYRQFGDTRALATAMVAMAWQAQRNGRYADATALFEETVLLWEQLGDAVAADLARSNTATTAKLEGDFERRADCCEQVASASETRGDVRGVAAALNGLGDVAHSDGDHEAARRYHHAEPRHLSAHRGSLGDRRRARRSRTHRRRRVRLRRGPRVAHAGAAGLPRAGTPARGGTSARDAVVVRQPPVTRSRRGGPGERGGRHPHEDRLPAPQGRTASGLSRRWRWRRAA